MTKRVLVTGSSGFVGHHLVQYLLDHDYEVVGLDSLNRCGDSQRLVFLGHKNYTNVLHDLRVPLTDALLHKVGKVDTVFSVASDSSVATSVSNPVDVVTNNVQLVLNLLEACRKLRPSKFVHLSTDEVYGEAHGGVRHKEGWTYYPSNPYSASKACQDAVLFSYWRTYNVPLVLVHCANMFGPRQNPEKMVPKTVKYLLEGRTVQVYTSNGKVGERVYTDVRNLTDALIHVDNNVSPNVYSKLPTLEVPTKFNVSGGELVNNLELVKKVADVLNLSVYHVDTVSDNSVRPGYDRSYGLDDSLLRNTGWVPPYSLEDGLRYTVQWSKEHPEWLS